MVPRAGPESGTHGLGWSLIRPLLRSTQLLYQPCNPGVSSLLCSSEVEPELEEERECEAAFGLGLHSWASVCPYSNLDDSPSLPSPDHWWLHSGFHGQTQDPSVTRLLLVNGSTQAPFRGGWWVCIWENTFSQTQAARGGLE